MKIKFRENLFIFSNIILSMEYVSGSELESVCENPSEQLENIWSSRMSSSYVDTSLLDKGLSGDEVLYAAVEDGNILGYAAGSSVGLSDMSASFSKEDIEEDLVESTGQVAVLEIVAVREGEGGRGIGSSVLDKTVSDLNSSSDAVFAEAWIRPGKTDGSDVLESVGFRELYNSSDYWKPKTKDFDTECPECGNTTCSCSGALYVFD